MGDRRTVRVLFKVAIVFVSLPLLTGDSGEIAEIRRGSGSAARLLHEQDARSALGDDAWTLVVNPDWWNDSITLRFRERHLAEIYRFRMCCELP